MFKTSDTPDCNRCDRSCPYSFKMRRGTRVFKYSGQLDERKCKLHKRPREGWRLAELALANPTGLNEALSGLGDHVKVNLSIYLR